MSKIHSIHINNFKFFGESRPIVLEGKNLLLYGENGSGKSSIYNSLYTLLEAASKTPEEVQKYFLSPDRHSQSLVNINAPVDTNGQTNSYIDVVDDNGKHLRLAYDDTAICGNNECKESQRASDFINYKSLFSFQLFRNSELTDLHDVFDYSIIPYLTCSAFDFLGQEISSLSELFRLYKDVDAYKDVNRKGKKVIYKRGAKYICFKKLEGAINAYMFKLIENINIRLNEENGILEQLGYTFKAKLEYHPLFHRKTYTNIISSEYKVLLSIVVKRDGEDVVLKHPNVFLNEAKMSALAFGIRWAILSKRPNSISAPNALHVLVLDDLLISLDMNNRNAVIKYLLYSEEAADYQILFITHERTLFDCMSRHLQTKYRMKEEELDKHGWLLMEIYDHTMGDKHYPVIQSYQSNYIRAVYFFNGHGGSIDYCACGNALRKAIEGEFRRIYTLWHVDNNGETVNEQTKLMMQSCIELGWKEFPRHRISTKVLVDLQHLTSFVLNPASHYNPESNFYRAEIEKAFEILGFLQKIDIVDVVPKDSVLSFSVACESGHVFGYEMRIYKEIIAIVSPMSAEGELLDLPMQVAIRLSGSEKEYTQERKRLQDIYSETIQFLVDKGEKPICTKGSLFDFFLCKGETITQMFMHKNEELKSIQV